MCVLVTTHSSHHLRHVTPISPPFSARCAYFPSPRGTHPNFLLVSCASRPPLGVSVCLWQIPCSQQFAASFPSLCALFRTPFLCFQQLGASFSRIPGGGVPLKELVCYTEAQKCPFVSPLLATLTHSLSLKSFPCDSYENTRDRVAIVAANFCSRCKRSAENARNPFTCHTSKKIGGRRRLRLLGPGEESCSMRAKGL